MLSFQGMSDSQLPLLTVPELTKLDTMTREDLIAQVELYRSAYASVMKAVEENLGKLGALDQEKLALQEQLLIVRHKLFGASSEKRPKPKDEDIERAQKNAKERGEKDLDPRTLLPSLKYPDVPLRESHLTFEEGKEPCCTLCEAKLSPMGDQTEDAEWVSVTQKIYYVQRQKRQKYRCGKCHGNIQTTPGMPRIASGSFSDEIAVDVAVAKYCDHLPINRYVKQAERRGLKGVSAPSLIDQTHYLSDFLKPIYESIKKEVQASDVLGADETHWKMLEGDETPRWQLWGFFTGKSAYYEAHDTRAAEVAEAFLKGCKTQYLVSDAYSGYYKCTKNTEIRNAFCHSHARRKWKDSELKFPEESKFMLESYDQLYEIEREIKQSEPDKRKAERERRSRPILEAMHKYATELWCLPESGIGKARYYFLKHFHGLSRFLENGRVPIDNNRSERGLRGPVLGRKNFYGNHSKRGAETMQVLYSIIESCKLSKVEPHGYLLATVQSLHGGAEALTPAAFALKQNPLTEAK